MRLRRLIHEIFDHAKDELRKTFVHFSSVSKTIEFDMREVLEEFDSIQPQSDGPIKNLNSLGLRELDGVKLELPWMSQSLSTPLVDLLGISLTFETGNRMVKAFFILSGYKFTFSIFCESISNGQESNHRFQRKAE